VPPIKKSRTTSNRSPSSNASSRRTPNPKKRGTVTASRVAAYSPEPTSSYRQKQAHEAEGAGGVLAGIFVVILILGIAGGGWQLALLGSSGLLALSMCWVAFKSRSRCRVRWDNGNFCPHWGEGILLGCKRHRYRKLQAWLRYLGLGRIGALLGIDIPILPWQVGGQATEQSSTLWTPDACQDDAQSSERERPAVASGKPEKRETSITTQKIIGTIALLANIATIVGLIFTIIYS
jgi:hypothetical protein